MTDNETPSAEISAELNPEVGQEEVIQSQEGDEGAPQDQETDEQKNARIQEEDAERVRQKEQRRQDKLQRRFDEITADKHAALRLAEVERQRATELSQQIEQLRQGGNKPQGEPQRDQFESYEDYLDAKVEYRATKIAEERLGKFEETHQQRSSVQEEHQRVRQLEQRFIENRLALEKDYPDYREVIEDWEPVLGEEAVRTIVQLDEGPLLTYHLAKNPSLEQRLQKTPPHMLGVEIGKILASLKSPPKASSAPPPGKPVAAVKNNASSDGFYNGSPDGYFAWANKNLR